MHRENDSRERHDLLDTRDQKLALTRPQTDPLGAFSVGVNSYFMPLYCSSQRENSSNIFISNRYMSIERKIAESDMIYWIQGTKSWPSPGLKQIHWAHSQWKWILILSPCIVLHFISYIIYLWFSPTYTVYIWNIFLYSEPFLWKFRKCVKKLCWHKSVITFSL